MKGIQTLYSTADCEEGVEECSKLGFGGRGISAVVRNSTMLPGWERNK